MPVSQKKDLKNVLEVRTSLEVLATELACERMTQDEMRDLEAALEAFEAALPAEM